MEHKPEDYKYIRMWGLKLGSMAYYIKNQQEQAAKENAPLDAIFKRHGKEEWAVADEATKKELERSYDY